MNKTINLHDMKKKQVLVSAGAGAEAEATESLIEEFF
jgi:hypothetical protein